MEILPYRLSIFESYVPNCAHKDSPKWWEPGDLTTGMYITYVRRQSHIKKPLKLSFMLTNEEHSVT